MPDKEKAIRWGEAVYTRMKERGVRPVDVERATGIKAETLAHWRHGRSLAAIDSGLAVSDFLDSLKLRALIMHLRTDTCARKECGREFINNQRNWAGQRFCGPRCRSVAFGSKREPARERKRAQRFKRNGRLLAIYQGAISETCRDWCVNDGLCPDATCPIQVAELSPLPVDRRRFTSIAGEGPSTNTGIAAERIA